MTDIYTVPTEPTNLPIDLVSAKAFMKVTNSVEDSLITSLMTQATLVMEAYLNRWFITREDVVGEFDSIKITRCECYPFIEVRRAPLISVASIETFTNDAYEALMVDEDYEIKKMDGFSRILFYENLNVDSEKAYPLRMTFNAGYGATNSDVPTSIQLALLQLTNYLYLNRGDCLPECVKGGAPVQSVPPHIASLVSKYRILNTFSAIC